MKQTKQLLRFDMIEANGLTFPREEAPSLMIQLLGYDKLGNIRYISEKDKEITCEEIATDIVKCDNPTMGVSELEELVMTVDVDIPDEIWEKIGNDKCRLVLEGDGDIDNNVCRNVIVKKIHLEIIEEKLFEKLLDISLK